MFSTTLLLFLLLALGPKDSRGLSQITVPAASAAEACPVTYPDGSSPPGEQSHPAVGYANKNKTIWVGIPTNGVMRVRREKDGWLWAPKIAWGRGVHGQLVLTGRRPDRSAVPMRSVVSDSYGDIGFQPTSLGFPSEGCWEITGRVGGEELTFVNKVRRKQNW
jgi:hypothetical protein